MRPTSTDAVHKAIAMRSCMMMVHAAVVTTPWLLSVYMARSYLGLPVHPGHADPAPAPVADLRTAADADADAGVGAPARSAAAPGTITHAPAPAAAAPAASAGASSAAAHGPGLPKTGTERTKGLQSSTRQQKASNREGKVGEQAGIISAAFTFGQVFAPPSHYLYPGQCSEEAWHACTGAAQVDTKFLCISCC